MSKSNLSPLNTQWLLVMVLWFSGMGAAMQFAKVSLTFELLSQHYQADDNLISWILSATSFIGMVLGASASMFINRLGYKPALLAALAMGAVFSIAQSFLPPLAVFLLLRTLEGAAHLAIVVAAPTLMSAASASQHRSLVLSLWGTFFGVAYAITTTFAPHITQAYGIQGLYGAHAAWLLITLLLLWLMLPAKLITARPVTLSLHSMALLHRRIYSHIHTAFPSVVFMCYTTLYVSLLTFFPRIGHSPEWVMIASPLVSIGGAFFAGFLMQYVFNPPQMVRLAFISVATMFVAMFVAQAYGVDVSIFKLLIFVGLGLVQASIYSIIPFLAHDPHEQAHSIAAMAQLGNLGSAFGPPLFALIWTFAAINGVLALSLLIMLMGLGWTVFIFKKLHITKPA